MAQAKPRKSGFGKLCVALTPGGRRKTTVEEDEKAPGFKNGNSEDLAEEAEDDLSVPSDGESDLGEEMEESFQSESEKMKLMRTKTLEKYTKVLSGSADRSKLNHFDQKFQERREKQKLDKSKESDPGSQRTRRKRAQTLQQNFFERVLENSRASIDFGGLNEDDSGTVPLRDRVSILDADGTFNYSAMDNELETSLNELMQSQTHLERGEPEKLEVHRRRIAEMSKRLLAEQEETMRLAKLESKKLTPKMKKHMQKVSAELSRKLKENHAQGGLTARSNAQSKRSKAKAKLKLDSRRDLHKNLTEEGQKDQEHFETEVSKLQKELALLQKQFSTLRLEQKFPRGMQWKIKVDAGDGTYIGVRDLEIGKIKADFAIQTGQREANRVRLTVTNIEATVGMLDFSIRGANAKAKILGGLLTPTINRLDLDVKGEWTLELRFLAGNDKKQEARWEEVREHSRFNLEISRKVTGLTTMRLPQSFLQSLSKLFIPKLISGTVRSIIPVQIGVLLSENYNTVNLEGKIDVKGEMSPTVWREPLVGPTAAAAHARELLGISEEEAVMVDFMCRGQRAAAAGFKRKAISLARLFKWRLKYATYKIADLEAMLNVVQHDANVSLPSGWFAQLVKYVTLLAKKPLDLKIMLTRVQCDVDLGQALHAGLDIYLSMFRANLHMARAEKAKVVALRQLEDAEGHAVTITNLFQDYLVPSISPSLQVVVNGMLLGGLDTGLVALALRDAKVQAKLPMRFLFRGVFPAYEFDHSLEFEGIAGPRADEYTLRITELDKEQVHDGEKRPDSEIAIRNTKIELFPQNSPPGTVRLDSTLIRASLQLNTLDIMLHDLRKSVEAKQGDAANKTAAQSIFLFDESEELIARAQQVVGLFRNFDQEAEDADDPLQEKQKPQRESKVLPNVLALNSYDTRFDIKGLQVEAKKVSALGGGETLRVTVQPQEESDQNQNQSNICAFLRVRLNMRDMFDEIM